MKRQGLCEKKNHKESNGVQFQHFHKFEPGNDRSPKKKKGKVISVYDSRIIDLDIDDPISIRKLIKSCTMHPLSNFISYSNLSSSFIAFIS